MKNWLTVAAVSILLTSCGSFGTTQDRWTDRYEAQTSIMESIRQMRHARLEHIMQLIDSVHGETRGMLMALVAMDVGADYRDYADVLAAITPPDRTSGEILAQGVADVLPLAVIGASMGWMSTEWARQARGPSVPTTDNRVSYSSGGDMGFGSWNPSTVTTTTTSTALGGP